RPVRTAVARGGRHLQRRAVALERERTSPSGYHSPMKKLSRRELGQMAAADTVAQALPLGAQPFDSAEDGPSGSAQGRPDQIVPSSYIGPLTGVTSGLDGRRFDPVAYTRERYAAAPRRLRFQARTLARADEGQK